MSRFLQFSLAILALTAAARLASETFFAFQDVHVRIERRVRR